MGKEMIARNRDLVDIRQVLGIYFNHDYAGVVLCQSLPHVVIVIVDVNGEEIKRSRYGRFCKQTIE